MKKIIFMLLLVTVCVVALASCGETAPTVTVDTFQTAIENTNPTKVSVNTTTTDALGELKGGFVAVIAEDGSSVITYSYDKWLAIGEGAEGETKDTVSGTVYCDANGNYTGDVEGAISDVSAQLVLNLKAITSEVTISEDETTLTAVVAAADTKAVFGEAYSYDISIKVVKNDTAIATVTMTYTNGGTAAEIFARYE